MAEKEPQDDHPIGLSDDGKSLIEGSGEYDFDISDDDSGEESSSKAEEADQSSPKRTGDRRGLRVVIHRS